MARAWSGTFDDMIGNVMANYFSKHAAMGLPGLAPYPDFFAAGLIMLLAGIESSFASFLLTCYAESLNPGADTVSVLLGCRSSCVWCERINDGQQGLHER